MDCPACQSSTYVVETRSAEDGTAVRRRRECSGCGRRFTSFERPARVPLYVRKRSGKRQQFDRPKLLEALRRAAHKRPVETAELELLVEQIESDLAASGGELPANRVGELCLEGLARLDRGAYLQYAGVFDVEAAGPALIAARGGHGSVRAGGEDATLPREAG